MLKDTFLVQSWFRVPQKDLRNDLGRCIAQSLEDPTESQVSCTFSVFFSIGFYTMSIMTPKPCTKPLSTARTLQLRQDL